MTCVGHTNSCPSHVGYYPPEAAVGWTDTTLDTNIQVKAQHYNELLYYIEVERQRWATFYGMQTAPGWSGMAAAKNTYNVIYASDYKLLRDQMIVIAGWWGNETYSGDSALSPGNQIQDETTTDLRVRLNQLRTWCICDCNYACTCDCNYCVCNCNYACTCNCNYCTCNCNYCVCNCNYCVCNCNYACTCFCNYYCICECNYYWTCFPAGSMVLMADKTYKRIETIKKGDMLQGIHGPVSVEYLDITKLGNRHMMTFEDRSVFWSEEHPFWARKDGKEWWWTANAETWRKEVETGAIAGLKDNYSILTGDGFEFAHIDGWKEKNVVVSDDWFPETPLYMPRAFGSPIIINGYVVTSGTDEFKFDYTKIDWNRDCKELKNEIHSNKS